MHRINQALAASCLLFALTACQQTGPMDSTEAANNPPPPNTAPSIPPTYPATDDSGLTDEEIAALLAEQALRDTPITDNEWDQITSHPYRRDPFLQYPQLSQRYFEAYLAATRTQWVDPGSLRLPPFHSGSGRTLHNAAWNTGWSAGMTRQPSQLTPEERERINELKTMYDESLGNS